MIMTLLYSSQNLILFLFLCTNIAQGRGFQPPTTSWRIGQGLKLLTKKQVQMQDAPILKTEKHVNQIQDDFDTRNNAAQIDIQSLLNMVREGFKVIKDEIGGLKTEVHATRRAMEEKLETGLKTENNKVKELVADMKADMADVKRKLNEIRSEFVGREIPAKSDTILQKSADRIIVNGLDNDETKSNKTEKVDQNGSGERKEKNKVKLYTKLVKCNKNLRRETEEIKEELKALRVYQEEEKHMVKELKEKVTRNSQNVRQRVDELTIEIRNSRADIYGIKKTVHSENEKVEKFREQIIATKGGLQRLNDGIRIIQAEVVGTKYQISLVKDQVKMTKYELIVVQDLVNVERDHTKVVRHQVSSLSDRVKHLQNDVSTIKDSVQSFKRTLTRSKLETTDMKSRAQPKWNRDFKTLKQISLINFDLRNVKKNVSCLKERMGNVRDRIRDIRKDVARVSNEVIGSLGETLWGVVESVVKMNDTINRHMIQIRKQSEGGQEQMKQVYNGISDVKQEISDFKKISEKKIQSLSKCKTEERDRRNLAFKEVSGNVEEIDDEIVIKITKALDKLNGNGSCITSHPNTQMMFDDIQKTLKLMKDELMFMRERNKSEPTIAPKPRVFKSKKALISELEQVTGYGIRACQQMMHVFSVHAPKLVQNNTDAGWAK